MEFRGTAKVSQVIASDVLPEEEKRITKVLLDRTADLPEGLDLTVMQYSLTLVRNTRSPHVHFRRGYRLLPKVDFETLKGAEAFVARTGYFELINALPQTLQASFAAEEILSASSDPRRTAYRVRLDRLYSFLDQRVFAVGRLLEAVDAAVRNLGLTNAEGVALEHLFVDEVQTAYGGTLPADNLAAQVRRFAGLNKEFASPLTDEQPLTEKDVVLQILEELDRPERRTVEARFERLFALVQ